jgi:hypothetical protein
MTGQPGALLHGEEGCARHAQMVDTSMSHIGFRCIRRDPNRN